MAELASLFTRIAALFAHYHPISPPATATVPGVSDDVNIIKLVPSVLSNELVNFTLVREILPPNTPINYQDLTDAINAHAANYHLTAAQLPMWFCQTMYESANFTALEEILYYSTALRITQVWPSRFPTLVSAAPYVKAPEKLANLVYANRMGNGNAASGDGWTYRGAGAIQLTGKENHIKFARANGRDTQASLKYIRTLEGAVESSMFFWQAHDLHRFTTHDDVAEATQIINGGTTGLTARVALFDKVAAVV